MLPPIIPPRRRRPAWRAPFPAQDAEIARIASRKGTLAVRRAFAPGFVDVVLVDQGVAATGKLAGLPAPVLTLDAYGHVAGQSRSRLPGVEFDPVNAAY